MTRKSPIKQNDYVFAGEDVTLEFTVYDSNLANAGVVDLTGYSITFRLVDNIASPAQTVTKTVGSGITLSDPTNGVLQVALTDADTENLSAGEYQYSLKRTDAGAESVLAFGSFYIGVGPQAG